ncbi:hypothetical protein K440DRAFT_607770 [Wilcoxina mikolae CBS 423.85]|nr:hypothetical protein K440DRAFT_607770 [Wilcoxina mikolae CBS 423.85]
MAQFGSLPDYLLLVLFAVVSFWPAASAAIPVTTNTTIPLNGATNHGDPNFLCTPATWVDIALFLLVNYGAHAATVKSMPGEKTQDMIFNTLLALCFPYSGIVRGLDAIARCAYFNHLKNELQMAARAGALCHVIETELHSESAGSEDTKMATEKNGPQINEVPQALTVRRDHKDLHLARDVNSGRIIHGSYTLPALNVVAGETGGDRAQTELAEFQSHGDALNCRCDNSRKPHLQSTDVNNKSYKLEILPYDQKVYALDKTEIHISSSYNAPKIIVALVQTVSASITLYQIRGDQIDRYGYAAFGLTVIPYILMSVVNLIGNLVTPDYPTLYLVRSQTMCKAEKLGAKFDGVVGTIDKPSTAGPGPEKSDGNQRWWNLWTASIASVIFCPIPFVIISALTKFHPAKSTFAQRFWLMSWLTLSVFGGMQPFFRTIGGLLFGLFKFFCRLGKYMMAEPSENLSLEEWLTDYITVGDDQIPRWIRCCLKWVGNSLHPMFANGINLCVIWLFKCNCFAVSIGWCGNCAVWLLLNCIAPTCRD